MIWDKGKEGENEGERRGGTRGRGGGETQRTGVPYLQTDEGVGVCVYYPLRHERCPDSGGCFGWVEGAFAVPGYEGGFAYTLGAEDDDFGFEGGRHFLVTVSPRVFFG